MELEQENTLPEKCRSCRGTKAGAIHSGCPFCMDAQFQERILCDLNRSIQDQGAFQCGAYRPGLELVGASERKQTIRPPQVKNIFRERAISGYGPHSEEKVLIAVGSSGIGAAA